jgi:tetratricopeptide (TPR) repeat protein
MTQAAKDSNWLRGKKVVITGRLASMSRAEATRMIYAHGGKVFAAVTSGISYVIVGQPLGKNGRLTSRLIRAQRLEQCGYPIQIVPEDEFRDRLGLSTQNHRLHTTTQAAQILRISPRRVEHWLRAGLIQARDTVHGVSYFDYQQLAWARTLSDLADAGVRAEQIQRSLEQLRRWLPEIEQPLAQLGILADGRQLLVRLENGQLAEPAGQPHLNFDDESQPTAVVSPSAPSATDWFHQGCELEEQGRLTEALDAYRQALLVGGPQADACFNLANVLYALGEKGPAAERYQQAVELDSSFASAWNNLGNVLAELGAHTDAVRAYEQALVLMPDCADTHYNMADTLDEIGKSVEARQHWVAFLREDPRSSSAAYARSRLEPTARAANP